MLYGNALYEARRLLFGFLLSWRLRPEGRSFSLLRLHESAGLCVQTEPLSCYFQPPDTFADVFQLRAHGVEWGRVLGHGRGGGVREWGREGCTKPPKD